LGFLRNEMRKVACKKCGASIVQATADSTGGLCMPCKSGTRESIDAAKAYYQRERELDKTDPMRLLWRDLVRRVYQTDLGYEGLSDAERKYFAVGLLGNEVYNGGFDQYFFNSSGSRYDDAERGLEEMGAIESLALLQRAKQALFGSTAVPTDTEKRRTILRRAPQSCTDQLDELDEVYWTDPDGLAGRLRAYAKRHCLLSRT
jgi:hypothetical protein